MGYHIGTMLIYEHFGKGKYCPLCKIKAEINERLTEQFLGESVMEDSSRARVNELGFCSFHYDKLFSMQSKLGLALQISTRLKNNTDKLLYKPINAKKAKKEADKISATLKTCVICSMLEDTMVRYYKTISRVYKDDPNFKTKILDGDGFCIEHYANLVRYSSEAGNKQNEYLETLFKAFRKKLEETENALDEFCNHHDYRKSTAPLSEEAANSLKTARNVLYGLNK